LSSFSSTQTKLVGGNGSLRLVPSNTRPSGKKSETQSSKPEKPEKVETRSIEVQTDVTCFSGELDHAEEIAYMTSREFKLCFSKFLYYSFILDTV
jgi:hypothetical protein